MGVEGAVGGNDAIAVEVVVGGRIATGVAAIHPYLLARNLALAAHGLVYHVPDETALILGILAGQFHVVHEAAHGVAHGVGIFALDERTVGIAFAILDTVVVVVVHGAEDVGFLGQSGTLVLHGARVVQGLDGMVCLLEVVAVSALVAHAPEDDGRMILLHLHVADVALHDGLAEVGVLCQACAVVAHAVALEVGLGADIDAVLVAKVVEIRVAGIVAGTHGIDVQFLHDADILQHPLAADDIAAVGVHLMAVGTLDEDGLAVEQDLCILDFYVAEAHALAYALDYALGIGQGDAEGVEVGGLGCPGLHVVYVRGEGSLGGGQFLTLLPNYGALGVRQGKFHFLALGAGSGEGNGELAHREVPVEVLADVYVLQVSLGAGIEVDFACYAGEAPEVLVLAVRTVAPAHYLHADEVLLARLQIACDVELGGILGVLAVAHLLAVDPKGEVAGGRAYVHDDVLALPVSRHHNLLAIRAGVVVLLLDVGRVGLELRGPCVTYVLIDDVAVAVQFEEAGHGKLHPIAVVVAGKLETLGSIVVMTGKVEVPHSLQRHVAPAEGLVALLRQGLGLKGKERGTGSQRVHTGHIRVHPRLLAVILGRNIAA